MSRLPTIDRFFHRSSNTFRYACSQPCTKHYTKCRTGILCHTFSCYSELLHAEVGAEVCNTQLSTEQTHWCVYGMGIRACVRDCVPSLFTSLLRASSFEHEIGFSRNNSDTQPLRPIIIVVHVQGTVNLFQRCIRPEKYIVKESVAHFWFYCCLAIGIDDVNSASLRC